MRNIAGEAGFEHLAQRCHVIAEPVLRHHGEQGTRGALRGDHRVALSKRGRHRLLHDHVHARVQERDREVGVRGGRGGDADQIELFGVQHRCGVVVGAGAGQASLHSHALGTARLHIGQRHHLAGLAELCIAGQVGGGDSTGSHDSYSQHVNAPH